MLTVLSFRQHFKKVVVSNLLEDLDGIVDIANSNISQAILSISKIGK